MKVLFLDIDGVLNSRKWYEANKEPINFESSFMYRHAQELDPAACALVNELCESEGLDIVISSTWRRLHKLQEISDMFTSRGLLAPVISSTPQLRSGFRGQEIAEWLYARYEVEKYVILDDDPDFYPNQPLVRTDNAVGITAKDIEKAKELLR
jgi:hypothetical protein